MLGETKPVWVAQRGVHRVQGRWWYSEMIGEGWNRMEGEKPKVTASGETAGQARQSP